MIVESRAGAETRFPTTLGKFLEQRVWIFALCSPRSRCSTHWRAPNLQPASPRGAGKSFNEISTPASSRKNWLTSRAFAACTKPGPVNGAEIPKPISLSVTPRTALLTLLSCPSGFEIGESAACCPENEASAGSGRSAEHDHPQQPSRTKAMAEALQRRDAPAAAGKMSRKSFALHHDSGCRFLARSRPT
jgi:hypothetical protein